MTSKSTISIPDEARAAARTHASDLYLSALLAPRSAQSALIGLAAFSGEIDRIVLTVSEPALAEIKLQWWRDTLRSGIDTSARSGSPVADHLIDVARAHGLPYDDFDRALDARVLDLYADPLPGEAGLDGYLDATVGFHFLTALRLINPNCDQQPRALVTTAARTYGRLILLRKSAAYLARGRSPFPGAPPSTDEALADMVRLRCGEIGSTYLALKQQWRSATSAERLACLPVCLVPHYLAAVTIKSHDLRRQLAEISPLTRICRLSWVYHLERL